MTRVIDPEAVAYVEALPRRTAHALHGLIVAVTEQVSPVTSREVQIYDGEAVSVGETAAGLRHAQKLDLCYFDGRYWWTGHPWKGMDYREALEDRYLRETDW